MAELTGDNTPLPQTGEDLVLTGSAVFAAGNAATTATISLGSITPSGVTGNAFDAKAATVAIANNGCGQTMNAATLSFVDTLGTQNVALNYTIPGVSIANNGNATFEIPFPAGTLRNVQLACSFASAPTAGSVAVEVVLQGSIPQANQHVQLISASGATTTQTSADQENPNARGVIVTLDMTSAGTGSVTLEIDAKDPISGKYTALLTGAAVTTNSTNQYIVYPGAPVTANVSASDPLPDTWRAKVTANNANATTYTVGASYII
jgi:hypothetical protein